MGSKVSSLNWLYIALFSLPVCICLASEELMKEAEEKGKKNHIIFTKPLYCIFIMVL